MRHWLVQFRKAKGLTQKETAEKIGISRSYYAGIEQGSCDASGKAAKLIADFFNFEMSLFFAEIGRETRQKTGKTA